MLENGMPFEFGFGHKKRTTSFEMILKVNATFLHTDIQFLFLIISSFLSNFFHGTTRNINVFF